MATKKQTAKKAAAPAAQREGAQPDARFVVNGVSKSGTYGVFGTGETLEAAKKRFVKEGGGLTRGYTVYAFGGDTGTVFAGIGSMGSVTWFTDHDGARPVVTNIAPRMKP